MTFSHCEHDRAIPKNRRPFVTLAGCRQTIDVCGIIPAIGTHGGMRCRLDSDSVLHHSVGLFLVTLVMQIMLSPRMQSGRGTNFATATGLPALFLLCFIPVYAVEQTGYTLATWSSSSFLMRFSWRYLAANGQFVTNC